jgi:hypothetical protein
MTATARAIADAVTQAREDLDQLRDHVGDLLAERRAVETAPIDRETAEARVRTLVEQARARGHDLFHRPEMFRAEPQPLSAHFQRRLSDEPLAALAVIAPDALVEAMLEGHDGDGLSPDARAAKLLDLDRRIEAATIAEELACREIERATGGMIARRADADPRLLLAFDHELQPEDEPEPDDIAPAEAGSTRRRK